MLRDINEAEEKEEEKEAFCVNNGTIMDTTYNIKQT